MPADASFSDKAEAWGRGAVDIALIASTVFKAGQFAANAAKLSRGVGIGDKALEIGEAVNSAKIAAKLSPVDLVINETLQSTGMITSQYRLLASEALQAGEKFLGSNYREIGKAGSGVFRSADSLRQFRMDTNSLLGRHKPWEPHIHLEMFKPQNLNESYINNHILFLE